MGGRSASEGRTGDAAVGVERRIIARLRFFYCGCGDTILVEDPTTTPPKWGIIDCRLSKEHGTYQRVRACLQDNNVDRLEFVCVSHPHRDHFYGMRELLEERFFDDESGSPRFGWFWDSGVNFKLLGAFALAQGYKIASKELMGLHEFLFPFIRDRVVRKWTPGPLSYAQAQFGGFRFVALSPEANRVDSFELMQARTILAASAPELSRTREHHNNLSLILAMTHKEHPVNIIFGADATAEVWNDALATWQAAIDLGKLQGQFDAVKVSHHGAVNGHHEALYSEHCRKGKTIAVLSAGPNDPLHPDATVLDSLRASGIRVYRTCWPSSTPPPARNSLPLPGNPSRKTGDRGDYGWADVVVEVFSNGDTIATPPEAMIS